MKVNSAYIVRDVFGKMILIPYRKTKLGNHPIYLNETGRIIVDALEDCDSETELCHRVAQAYNLNTDSEEYGQIEEFVNNLVSMGVVVI